MRKTRLEKERSRAGPRSESQPSVASKPVKPVGRWRVRQSSLRAGARHGDFWRGENEKVCWGGGASPPRAGPLGPIFPCSYGSSRSDGAESLRDTARSPCAAPSVKGREVFEM